MVLDGGDSWWVCCGELEKFFLGRIGFVIF